MSTTTGPLQSAVPSAVGYYYQGMYALVVLCDGSDSASVSVETDDDVVLDDTVKKLIQLKHSLGDKNSLSITDVGLWKAIRNWSGRPHDGSELFVFMTRAPVPDDSILSPLLRDGSQRGKVLKELTDEASRVRDERAAAQAAGKKPLPHESRAKSCEAFLALQPRRQKEMVRLIQIVPQTTNANDIPTLLAARLGNCLMPSIRMAVIERLIQWWDREIVLSLLDKRDKEIAKQEMLSALHRFIVENSEDNLPDDFSLLKPSCETDGIDRFMAKQIEWVNGGNSRLSRAALARWRARKQREAWMKNDVAIVRQLDLYDNYLVESWNERFGPAKDDKAGSDDATLCEAGLKLLDWSHLSAPNDLRPIRRLWAHAYLVQGSYQQLAEQGRVGWHPDYEQKYKALKEAD